LDALAYPLRRHTDVSVLRLRSNVVPGHEYWRSGGILLLDQARIQAWQQLLFVQCGDGWIVEEAWRRARRGYACGVDTATDLVARATALRGVAGEIEFKTWDGSRLPCPSAFYQGVFATLILEWCLNPAEVIGEIHRVLQPGGYLHLLERDSSVRCLPDRVASLAGMLRAAGFHEAGEVTRCDLALSARERVATVILHPRAAPSAGHRAQAPDRCGVA